MTNSTHRSPHADVVSYPKRGASDSVTARFRRFRAALEASGLTADQIANRVTRPESAGTNSRESAHSTHREPGAADFGGVKGMEGARLQSARAPRFAALAWRRPTEQRRFVRLVTGSSCEGEAVSDGWRSPCRPEPAPASTGRGA